MADETIQNLNIDISVDDKASSQIKSLEESIDSLLKKFETLDTKTDSLSKNLGDFGGADKSIDNAASKIDKMTKSAEKFSKTDISGNVGKQLDDVAQGYSKLELLQKSLEKQSEKSQGLVDKGKTIEDKALLNSLLQEYSKLEKVEREYAKQTAKSAPQQTKTAEKPAVSDKDFEAAYNAAKKYDNELSGLEAQAKALVAQMAKMSAEGKNFGTSWENSAKRLNKIQGQIKSIEAEQAKVQLDTSNLNVPDVKLDTKQAENLTRILDKAEQENNKFGESAKKAAVDFDYLMSSDAKLDYLTGEISKAEIKLKELAQGGKGYENKEVRNLIADIQKYQKSIDSINKAQQKSASNRPVIDNDYKVAEESAKKYATELSRLRIVEKSTLDRMAQLVAQGKNSGSVWDNLNTKLNKTRTAMQNLTSAQIKAGDTSKQVQKISNPFTRLINSLKNGKKGFNDFGKSAEKGFKKVDKGAKKSTKSTKKFGNGLRSILRTAKQFLIFGAFFTIQRQISDAFGEGTQNLYQYSKVLDGDFANSMDRITTSFLYLKNSIGAAVAPIINYLTPALESLIDTVAELGNKIAEVMAALTGQKVYTKAVKSYKEYAEAADTAAEATNNALASFDEINNLSSNKGGTIDETSNYGSMFEEQEVNLGKGLLAQFVDNLRSGNWGEAGSILAQKVNGVVNSINESNIGQKLADKFNNALKFANGFLGTFDFGMFGTTLFTQITNFIEEIDWGEIGRIFSNLIVGALDFTQAFIKWIFDPETYKKIFNAIVEFINGIDWHKVGTEIIETVTTLFDSVADFTIEPSTWAKISNALVTGLKDLIKGAYEAVIKWAEGKSFKELAWDVVNVIFWPFKMLFNAIYGLLGGLAEALNLPGSNKSSGIDMSKVDISKWATGGYPTTGQMFIARESGPELVGSIGGRTAVVNNDQIVQAVSMGVYNAVVDAFSTTSDNGDEQPVVVQIDGREVFRAVRSQNDNFRRRTGTSAF